jgi:GT2 family glycosyltransferase
MPSEESHSAVSLRTTDLESASQCLKVSIVVPTHFRPGMLSRLLDAIRVLEYPQDRLELIVVGAEKDSGRLAVESFARSVSFRVTYKIATDDTLRSVAYKRNLGARGATGDVLGFIDDDCVPHPQWIAAAASLFHTASVGGVEGLILVPRPDRPSLTYRGSLRLQKPKGYRTGNIFYRRSVFEQCGGFDESLPYLEDTDLGFTVIERGYQVPFSNEAAVDHPVQSPRPLVPLILAKTARDLPYLFKKHAQSKAGLRQNLRLFNRAHYPYLALYGLTSALIALNPLMGVWALGIGLCVLLPLHAAYDFWGAHFTISEFVLTGLSHPVIPVVRLCWWLVGSLELVLGLRKDNERASR